jgi:hypothetical protein
MKSKLFESEQTYVFTNKKKSVVCRNTAIRFQVNTSYTLWVKEIQFRLLSTTLLIFSAALDKKWIANAARGNEKVADPWFTALPLHESAQFGTILKWILGE